MTTKRLAIVLAVVFFGLSSVLVLPRQLGYQPAGLRMELPESLGEWWGHDLAVSDKEHNVLGADTTFARKDYQNGRGDHAMVTIVLSGQDMMRNIHRPESCLEAQGWDTRDSSAQSVYVEGFGPFRVTRLYNSKQVRVGNQLVKVDGICYYCFIGFTRETGSHLGRVLFDSWDRLAKGYDQRWGMILVNSEITKPFNQFGRDQKETEEFLQKLIQQLAPKILLESVRPS